MSVLFSFIVIALTRNKLQIEVTTRLFIKLAFKFKYMEKDFYEKKRYRKYIRGTDEAKKRKEKKERKKEK